MGKLIIGILHQTIIDGDAIGNDILGMFNTLIEYEFSVNFLCEFSSEKFKQFCFNQVELQNFLKNPNAVIIYHHSVYWEYGEEILKNFQGRIIFKFHNITPPSFFKSYSFVHYSQCLNGIEQSQRLVNLYPDAIWWADSEYNASQLINLGLSPDNCKTLAPFYQSSLITNVEPNFEIISSLISNNCNNVLFVGRVAPNKGHFHLIRTIKEYIEMYDPYIHLWLVGSIDHDNLQEYNNQLSELIKRYDLEHNITITDKQSESNIKAYFLGCDEFLCLSEHEGFCVPIVEAQSLLLPVITYGGTTLQNTVGKNQIVLDTIDYSLIAAALFTVFCDEKIRKFCKYHGNLNVKSRFSHKMINELFISLLQEQIDGGER